MVTQHALAAEAGAQVLAQGGNAVDAAITAGFALAAVEPWMSGLGGCGFMVVYRASEQRSYALEFGVRSPAGIDPADYPLSTGFDSDLFAWPGVVDNRNVLGPYAVAVPGYVAGLGEAAGRFGTLPWHQLLAPAIALADKGLTVDWYSSLKIASSAPDIARFESTRSVYLPAGHVPVGHWAGPPPVIELTGLAATLAQLADEGPGSFYNGNLAERVLTDAVSVGVNLCAEDLASYRVHCQELSGLAYRDTVVYTPSGLCGGPSLCQALTELQERMAVPPALPDAGSFATIAASLQAAYGHRLAQMGDSPDGRVPACTTHLNVTDRDGNVVALTQTLLSVFGSRLLLPDTGILMNNGMMWFDPEPGRPNSIGAGRQPLSNMSPAIMLQPGGAVTALGASGGRRIVSAVLQLISFMADFSMDPGQAMHQARIDVGANGEVLADAAFNPTILQELRDQLGALAVAGHGVYPSLFGCPSIARFDPASGCSTGAAFVPSPLAAAVAEPQAS